MYRWYALIGLPHSVQHICLCKQFRKTSREVDLKFEGGWNSLSVLLTINFSLLSAAIGYKHEDGNKQLTDQRRFQHRIDIPLGFDNLLHP